MHADEIPTRRHRADPLWPGVFDPELLAPVAAAIADGTATACRRLGLALDRVVLVAEQGWPYAGWLPVTADANDTSMTRFLRGHWSHELRSRNEAAEVVIGDRLFFDWMDDADAAAPHEVPADTADAIGRWSELMLYALVAAGDALGRAANVAVTADELAAAVVFDDMPQALRIPALTAGTALRESHVVAERAVIETCTDDLRRCAGFVRAVTRRLFVEPLAAAGVAWPSAPIGPDAPLRNVGVAAELPPGDLLPGVAAMQRSLAAGLAAFGFGRPVRIAYGGRTVRARAVRAATVAAAHALAGADAAASIAVVDAAGWCDPADLAAFAAVAARTGGPFDALQTAARITGVPVLSGADAEVDVVPHGATVELAF